MTSYVAGTVLTCSHEHCGCRVVVQQPCGCSAPEGAGYLCGCGAAMVEAPAEG